MNNIASNVWFYNIPKLEMDFYRNTFFLQIKFIRLIEVSMLKYSLKITAYESKSKCMPIFHCHMEECVNCVARKRKTSCKRIISIKQHCYCCDFSEHFTNSHTHFLSIDVHRNRWIIYHKFFFYYYNVGCKLTIWVYTSWKQTPLW